MFRSAEGTSGEALPLTLELPCRRVDRHLTATEYCTLVISGASRSVSLAGHATLRSFPITQLDSTVIFESAAGGTTPHHDSHVPWHGQGFGRRSPFPQSASASGESSPAVSPFDRSGGPSGSSVSPTSTNSLRDTHATAATGSPLIINMREDASLVLLLESQSIVNKAVTMIAKLAAGSSHTPAPPSSGKVSVSSGHQVKLIHYYMPTAHWSFESFASHLSSADGKGFIRWQAATPVAIVPFPHTRLDFLSFHGNRSVMQRLSATGDRLIEFSSNSVLVGGHVVEDHFQTMGGGPRKSSIEEGGRRPATALCVNEILTKLAHCTEHYQIREIAEFNQEETLCKSKALSAAMWHSDVVTILSDKALYLTERTGRVVQRMGLDSVKYMLLPPAEATTSSSQPQKPRVHYADDTSLASCKAPTQQDAKATGGLLSSTGLMTDDMVVFVLNMPPPPLATNDIADASTNSINGLPVSNLDRSGKYQPHFSVVALRSRYVRDLANRLRLRAQDPIHLIHSQDESSSRIGSRRDSMESPQADDPTTRGAQSHIPPYTAFAEASSPPKGDGHSPAPAMRQSALETLAVGDANSPHNFLKTAEPSPVMRQQDALRPDPIQAEKLPATQAKANEQEPGSATSLQTRSSSSSVVVPQLLNPPPPRHRHTRQGAATLDKGEQQQSPTPLERTTQQQPEHQPPRRSGSLLEGFLPCEEAQKLGAAHEHEAEERKQRAAAEEERKRRAREEQKRMHQVEEEKRRQKYEEERRHAAEQEALRLQKEKETEALLEKYASATSSSERVAAAVTGERRAPSGSGTRSRSRESNKSVGRGDKHAEAQESVGRQQSPEDAPRQQSDSPASPGTATSLRDILNQMPEGAAAVIYMLHRKVEDLTDTVSHRDMTIRLLQQRCEQLTEAEGAPLRRIQMSEGPTSGSATPRSTASRGRSPASNARSSTPKRSGVSTRTSTKGQETARSSGTVSTSGGAGSGNPPGGGGGAAAGELMRHYTMLLEGQLRNEINERKALEKKVMRYEKDLASSLPNKSGAAQERSTSADSTLVEEGKEATIAALRLAFDEAVQREQYYHQKLQRAQLEHKAVLDASNESLKEMGRKASDAVQEFVLSYHHEQRILQQKQESLGPSRAGTGGSSGGLPKNWNDFVVHLNDMETRVQAEVALRTKELAQANAALVQELRSREAEVDKLMTQVLGPSGLAQPLQTLDVLRMAVDELNQKKEAMEMRTRSLQRQVDDLSHARKVLIEEDTPDIKSHLATRNPHSDGNASAQALKEQVIILQRLQHVPLLVNRLASLELLAGERDEIRAQLLDKDNELREAGGQLKATKNQNKTLKEELADVERSQRQSEGYLRDARHEVEKLMGLVAELREEKDATEKNFRKQIKYQKDRIHDLLTAAKSSGPAPATASTGRTAGPYAATDVSRSSVSLGAPSLSPRPTPAAARANTPIRGSATPRGVSQASSALHQHAEQTLMELDQAHPDWQRTPSVKEREENRTEREKHRQLNELAAENAQLSRRLEDQESKLQEVLAAVQHTGKSSRANNEQSRTRPIQLRVDDIHDGGVSPVPLLSASGGETPNDSGTDLDYREERGGYSDDVESAAYGDQQSEGTFGVVRASRSVMGNFVPAEELQQLQAQAKRLQKERRAARTEDDVVKREATRIVSSNKPRPGTPQGATAVATTPLPAAQRKKIHSPSASQSTSKSLPTTQKRPHNPNYIPPPTASIQRSPSGPRTRSRSHSQPQQQQQHQQRQRQAPDEVVSVSAAALEEAKQRYLDLKHRMNE